MSVISPSQLDRIAMLAAKFIDAHDSRAKDYQGLTLRERETFYVLYGAMAALAGMEKRAA